MQRELITLKTIFHELKEKGHGELLFNTAEEDFASDPLTAEDLAEYVANDNLRAKKGRFLDVDQILAQKEPEWLVENLIPRGGIGIVYGASGTYKTFFALDIAARCTLGMDAYFSRKTKKAEVIYIAAEGGTGFRIRLPAWMKHHGRKPVGLYLQPFPSQIDTEATANQLIEDILEQTPLSENRLIVLDTLSANFRGNENSDEVAQLLSQCQKIALATNATFLIIHHTGKEAGREERGHYSLRANVDFSIRIDADKTGIIVSVKKSKDAACAEPFKLEAKYIEVNSDSEFPGSLVLLDQAEFVQESHDNELVYAAAIELGDNQPQKKLRELLHTKYGLPKTRTTDRLISKAIPDNGKPVIVKGHALSRVRLGSGSKSPVVISVKPDI